MSNHAVLWSQPNCAYCEISKRLLLDNEYVVTEKKIGVNVTKEEFIAANPGARSVPQIWLNGVLVPNGFSGLPGVLDD